MASQKLLMVLPLANMADLHAGPATGMGFYLFESGGGFIAALVDGAALPLFSHAQYYCLDDLLNGDLVPARRMIATPVTIKLVFPTRFRAGAALATLHMISLKLAATTCSSATIWRKRDQYAIPTFKST